MSFPLAVLPPTLPSPLPWMTAPARRLRTWPVHSQQRACRNAALATDACGRRRIERQHVADFLAARYPTPAVRASGN